MASKHSPLINSLSTYLAEVSGQFTRINLESQVVEQVMGQPTAYAAEFSVVEYFETPTNFRLGCVQLERQKGKRVVSLEDMMLWFSDLEDNFLESDTLEEALRNSRLSEMKYASVLRDLVNIARQHELYHDIHDAISFGSSNNGFGRYVIIFVQLQEHVVYLKFYE